MNSYSEHAIPMNLSKNPFLQTTSTNNFATKTGDDPHRPSVSRYILRTRHRVRSIVFYQNCRTPSSTNWVFRNNSSSFFSRAIRATTWRRAGSNRRPPGCKPGALPTELRPRPGVALPPTKPNVAAPRPRRLQLVRMGLVGFEPTTSPLSGARSKPTELQARFDLQFTIYD